jgi:hypothetical protein
MAFSETQLSLDASADTFLSKPIFILPRNPIQPNRTGSGPLGKRRNENTQPYGKFRCQRNFRRDGDIDAIGT